MLAIREFQLDLIIGRARHAPSFQELSVLSDQPSGFFSHRLLVHLTSHYRSSSYCLPPELAVSVRHHRAKPDKQCLSPCTVSSYVCACRGDSASHQRALASDTRKQKARPVAQDEPLRYTTPVGVPILHPGHGLGFGQTARLLSCLYHQQIYHDSFDKATLRQGCSRAQAPSTGPAMVRTATSGCPGLACEPACHLIMGCDTMQLLPRRSCPWGVGSVPCAQRGV